MKQALKSIFDCGPHRKLFHRYFTIIALVIMCSDLGPAQVYDRDTFYLPLVVGNTWVYRNWDTTKEAVRDISRSMEIGGQTYFILNARDLLMAQTRTDTVRMDEMGNLYRYYKGVERLWFDFSLPEGIYIYNTNFYFGDTQYVSVSRNLTLSTPGGTFTNCIRFFFNAPKIMDDEYEVCFAPNIGFVEEGGAWIGGWKYFSGSINLPKPPPPTLQTPLNNSTDQPVTVTLNWSSVPAISKYWVQVSTNSKFPSGTVINDSTSDAIFRVISGLLYDTTYYWRVRAKGKWGYSLPSEPWSFKTILPPPPPSPVLVTPRDNGNVDTTDVSFIWKSSFIATRYHLQVSQDSFFTTLVVDDSIITDTVKNVSGLSGIYYWRVAASNSGGTSPWSVLRSLYVGCTPLNVKGGWNLISLPLRGDEQRRLVIFPDAVSDAFAFGGTYVPSDTLTVGNGYWLKMAVNQTVILTGKKFICDSIAVQPGWNLIGSPADPILTDSILSDSPDLITSNFFGYNSGYYATDTLGPGKGYWVKVNQPGTLIFSSENTSLPKLSAGRIRIVPTNELPPSPPDESIYYPSVPKQFGLEQAYPNPFNPTTTIDYQLPADSKITLRIFNVLGKVEAVLVDGLQSAGYKSVTWNASNVPSGLYFYKLDGVSMSEPGMSFTQVKKMILLK